MNCPYLTVLAISVVLLFASRGSKVRRVQYCLHLSIRRVRVKLELKHTTYRVGLDGWESIDAGTGSRQICWGSGDLKSKGPGLVEQLKRTDLRLSNPCVTWGVLNLIVLVADPRTPLARRVSKQSCKICSSGDM